MVKSKVFGVGFHRSGTTTLQTALEELGYRVIGMRENDWKAFEGGDLDTIATTVGSFDGFRDMPWPLLYEWLYKNVPNAKFILTYRETNSWIKSCQNFYKGKPYHMFNIIYGVETCIGNEEVFRLVYDKHMDKVRSFFEDKSDIFIEVDWECGDGWPLLCEFLGEKTPQRGFPHANIGAYTLWEKVFRKLIYILNPSLYIKKVRDK